MQYSENLHLNLPEDSDPLDVSKLSENFEALDEAVSDAGAIAAEKAFKVGDTLTTWRTDLGENWLLCNGQVLIKDHYPELYPLCPGAESNLAVGDVFWTTPPDFYSSSPGNVTYGPYAICVYMIASSGAVAIQITNTETGAVSTIQTGLTVTTSSSVATKWVCADADNSSIYLFWGTNIVANSGYICMAHGHGDLMNAANWNFYQSPSVKTIEYPFFVMASNGQYSLVNKTKYEVYSILNDQLVVIQTGTLPSIVGNGLNINSPSVSSNRGLVVNGQLYAIFPVSSVFWCAKLLADFSGWENITNTTISTPGHTGSFVIDGSTTLMGNIGTMWLRGSYTPISGGSKKVFTMYCEISDELIFKNFSDINTSDFYSILKYKGKYYLFAGDGNVFCVDSITDETIGNLKNYTNFDVGTYKSPAIPSFVFASSDNVLATPLQANASDGSVLCIPNFAAPKISASAAYTYIKAKEGPANGNQ